MKSGLACLVGTSVDRKTLQALSPTPSTQAVSRTSLKSLRAFPTTCDLCPAGCGVFAYLDGERCVQILGNPDHPVNQGGICAKGIAGLNLVNDPERLLFPMKRIGDRGEGRWSRITWDEAYHMILSRMPSKKPDNNRRGFVLDRGKSDPLLDRFIEAVDIRSIIERPSLRGLNYGLASWKTAGSPRLIPDVAKSRIILNFGANPFAHHDLFLGLARRLVNARLNKGSKLYTFDVRMSETAAKSDKWIPIRPGTDGMAALALAHVIVNHDLADADFISRKTNTSLPALKRFLSDYTPAKAENICGIPAEVIEDLALQFARQKPSLALAGGGVADHENGFQNLRCVFLLNWLVGNLEQEGGLYYSRSPAPPSPLIAGGDGREWLKGVGELADSGSEVDLFFAYRANPVFSEPNCQAVQEYFHDKNRVRFVAVMDTYLTETALWADLVLPAATYLEGWGLEYAPSLDQLSVLNLRQPVVSLMSPARVLRSPDFDAGKLLDPSFLPRGEAKEIGNFCIEMAHRMGGDKAKSFPFKNTFEYIAREAAKIPELTAAGGLNTLKRNGFWIDTAGSRSGKTAIDSSRQRKIRILIVDADVKKPKIPALPDYQTIDSHIGKKRQELILTTYKTSFFAAGTANSKWLREIAHNNPVWINRGVAEAYGIKNGDRVRLSSATGSFVTQALVTDRIQPESVALAEGFGHTALGRIAKGNPFKSKDRDTYLVWWSKEGNGVNTNTVIEKRTDSISGAFVSKDTLVQIEKI